MTNKSSKLEYIGLVTFNAEEAAQVENISKAMEEKGYDVIHIDASEADLDSVMADVYECGNPTYWRKNNWTDEEFSFITLTSRPDLNFDFTMKDSCGEWGEIDYMKSYDVAEIECKKIVSWPIRNGCFFWNVRYDVESYSE